MRNYRKEKSGISREARQLKKRINRNRRRATFVGVLYTLGTIVLALVALILPIPPKNQMGIEYLSGTLSAMLENDPVAYLTNDIFETVKLLLYVITILVVFVNIIRALKRRRWLFVKTANEEYGFNRNAYAMYDLGYIYSASLTALTINGFLMIFLCKVKFASCLLFLGIVAAGIAGHFVCAHLGSKLSFFDVEDNQVVEEKREIGRFVPLFRNGMQVLACMLFMWGFLRLVNNGLSLDNSGLMVAIFAAIPCWMVLLTHAFGISEYGIEGPHGAGMKVSRVFFLLVSIISLVAGLDAIMAYLTEVMADPAAFFDIFWRTSEPERTLMALFVLSLLMFILEMIMRKAPRTAAEKEEDKLYKEEKKAAKLEKKEEKKAAMLEKQEEKQAKLAAKEEKKAAKLEKKAAKLGGDPEGEFTFESLYA